MVSLAVGYAVNNHLAFHLFTLSDPGTINLVKSSSSVVSAIVLWQFADRHPKRLQWVAIGYQMLGLVISQV
jgi:peptidoglycan biosynthesis protein MviN/MurJ (putative lipid II flippase)